MAAMPCNTSHSDNKKDSEFIENGHVRDRINGSSDDNDGDSSASEDDDDSVELREELLIDNTCVAIACDDGCVRIYSFSDSDQLMYNKSLPRVSGRALSVTWSPDANKIYSGSSDGFIRYWDARNAYEIYRITVGLGGLGSGPEVCIWSLLALRL